MGAMGRKRRRVDQISTDVEAVEVSENMLSLLEFGSRESEEEGRIEQHKSRRLKMASVFWSSMRCSHLCPLPASAELGRRQRHGSAALDSEAPRASLCQSGQGHEGQFCSCTFLLTVASFDFLPTSTYIGTISLDVIDYSAKLR